MAWTGTHSTVTRAGETKILYHLDDEDKPFLIKLSIPLEQVTLADFKAKLPRTNYKFFFRSTDPEEGEVKEEVSDDAARLPVYKGRIVAYMVSVDSSVHSDPNSQNSGSTRSSRLLLSRRSYENGRNTGEFGTVGRNRNEPQRAAIRSHQQKIKVPEMTNRGYETDSMVSVECRSCHSDSEYDGSSRISSLTDRTALSNIPRVQRKKRRLRRIDLASMNRASSMSSITETCVGDNIIRVNLNVEQTKLVGLKIFGPTLENPVEGVFVESVMKGSPADADGRIQPGDEILQVNSIRFRGLDQEQATAMVREASISGHVSLLIVKRYIRSPTESAYTIQDPNEDNPTRKEPSQPIDPGAWVAHIESLHLAESTPYRERTPVVSYRDEVPLRAHPPGYFMPSPMLSNELSVSSERIDVIRQMAKKDSGLDIRDRIWLKMSIPHAFMGKDLVTWLVLNIKDLKGRSEARKYAADLLKSGYIKHTVGTKDFSEKSYYTFSDLPNLTEDFAHMPVFNEEDFLDSESQLAAYSDLPDSVSQVGQNRHIYRPSSHNGYANGFMQVPRDNGRMGSGHSSGGSGSGSDRKQKSIIFEETSSQLSEIYQGVRNGVIPSVERGSRNSFQNSLNNPFEGPLQFTKMY